MTSKPSGQQPRGSMEPSIELSDSDLDGIVAGAKISSRDNAALRSSGRSAASDPDIVSIKALA